MSSYEYTDPDGDTVTFSRAINDGVVVVVSDSATSGVARIEPDDVPTVAAELLKVAGQESVIVAKAYEEVEQLGDDLTCGSGPETAHARMSMNPNWLRNGAANMIAIAEYIENKGKRDAEAAIKLHQRRNAIAREIMRNDDDLPVTDYASLTWYAQKAVDRIIELEDGQANA